MGRGDREISDVLVVGGGLAGLTLALQLRKRRPDLDIRIVDPQRRPAAERTSTVGESLSEVGSHYLREIIGLSDHLDAQQVPKFGLRFFVGSQDDLGDRFEIGPLHPKICEMDGGRFIGLPLRTHQVDRGRLENELARRCQAGGIVLLEGTRLDRVEIDPAGHKVFLTGDHGGELRARWIVFASGGETPGHAIQRRPLNHRIRAAWARVEGDLDVGTWSTNPSFAARTLHGLRRHSTNHMMGGGYWTWIIALPSDATSVGVVVDPDVLEFKPASYAEMVGWLAERDWRTAHELAIATPVDGDFHVTELNAAVAEQCFSAERWAVVGQAAAAIDVLYSSGADLIALGNTLLVHIIEREFEGGRIAGRCAVAERVFAGFAEGFADIYRGQYRHFGSPAHVATKVAWDSALYFGFHTLLFRHGLFGDPEFLVEIRPEVRAVQNAQARVQGRLRQGDFQPLVDVGGGTVEWGAIEWLMDSYFAAKEQPDQRAVLAALRASVARLERLARRVEGLG
ncbi:MAG: FAD-dependent oxidoreductase [Gemmatimonadales bacterium]